MGAKAAKDSFEGSQIQHLVLAVITNPHPSRFHVDSGQFDSVAKFASGENATEFIGRFWSFGLNSQQRLWLVEQECQP